MLIEKPQRLQYISSKCDHLETYFKLDGTTKLSHGSGYLLQQTHRALRPTLSSFFYYTKLTPNEWNSFFLLYFTPLNKTYSIVVKFGSTASPLKFFGNFPPKCPDLFRYHRFLYSYWDQNFGKICGFHLP